MGKPEQTQRATFTRMVDGTPDQWAIVFSHSLPYQQKLPERVLDHLRLLRNDFGGYAVDRLEHSLQTATRAHRDGRDEEYVVCALLHDIGDTLGPLNHADIAAAILKPFVSEKNLWIVEQHAIFQGYYFFEHLGLDKNARDRFRDHPWFADTAAFCARYDQNSFDPAYESMTLEEFEPMVRRVLTQPKRSIYLAGGDSAGSTGVTRKPAPSAISTR
ncbi:MAG TPA: HD domain-containing protein [Candidatus Binatia bacterium]|nr:HD domain-containing protein [Candidatus Binatia bacterium]